MDTKAFNAESSSDQRVIRVFVSSTFRDMQEERELLVKQVFPELRRVCAERFVTFTEVDLRWGITEEQQAEGRVLPICLEEIHRSRPYFIGLLGERYGWIPDTVPPEVVAREPWLREHVNGRTSVTELEILHGVLNNPAMEEHAFFYFRDPAYGKHLSEEQRREMVERDIPAEVEKLGEAEAARRTAERRTKLAALKERVRKAHRDGKLHFAPRDGYHNPKVLARAVRHDFIRLIDRLFPKGETPDTLTREARGHAAYAAGKLLAYVERPAHTAAIDAFVAAESALRHGSEPPAGQGFVLTGPSGGGKTALLAAWTRDWRQDHPDEFVFEHYFGATSESAAVPAFLRRLLGELKRRYALAEEIPSDPAKLREVLPLWLAQAAGRGRIVLVLDALNQIEGEEADRRLAWLPRYFPPQVRVIASALPGPALETLCDCGWKEHELPLADADERDAMADAFLRLYGRTLRADLRRQLVTAPGTANPLFLRTVLEELRQFGSFEQLPAKVNEYLTVTTPEALFRLVIRRWQQDFDGGRDLVRRSLRHLWAARQGLDETEWLELLATDKPLPRQKWTPLFLALEPHLAQRAGLFAFGHDFLRQAVRGEFLGDDAHVRAAHLALADYFQSCEMNPRRIAEEPWQLLKAGTLDRLAEILANLAFAHAIFKQERQDLLRYWGRLEELTSCRIADTYHTVIETPAQAQEHLGWVGYLLDVTGDKKNLLCLLEARERLARATADVHALLACLEGLAAMYFFKSRTLGDVAEFVSLEEVNQQKPMRLLREHEDLATRLGDKLSLQSGLGTQAQLLIWIQQHWLALDVLERQQQVCEQIGDRYGLARCLGNLAHVHNLLFEEKEALAFLERAEGLCREAGDMILLTELLDNHGEIYKDLRRPYEAIGFWQEEARLAAEYGLRRMLRLALGKLDQTYSYLGADQAALLLLAKEEDLCRELDDSDTLQQCYSRRRVIETFPPGDSHRPTMREFPCHDDDARRKGIVAMLNTIADLTTNFLPREPVIADILTNVAHFVIADTLLDPALAAELARVSGEAYKKRWARTCAVISPLGEALHRNRRFLHLVATDHDFRRCLQYVGSRLLHEVFPSLEYPEDEKHRAIAPLMRCSVLLLGDTTAP